MIIVSKEYNVEKLFMDNLWLFMIIPVYTKYKLFLINHLKITWTLLGNLRCSTTHIPQVKPTFPRERLLLNKGYFFYGTSRLPVSANAIMSFYFCIFSTLFWFIIFY